MWGSVHPVLIQFELIVMSNLICCLQFSFCHDMKGNHVSENADFLHQMNGIGAIDDALALNLMEKNVGVCLMMNGQKGNVDYFSVHFDPCQNLKYFYCWRCLNFYHSLFSLENCLLIFYVLT